ncbi:MAG: succinate dehydrogenase, hydrophobic membrane anchor protein [Gammaproteobacteria bacterium]
MSAATARQSTRHWWHQRLTAIALAPLSVWFIYALTTLPSIEYESARDWVAAPLTTVLLIIFIPCLFHHAQSGMQVVLEDYVNSDSQRAVMITLVKLTAVVAAAISIVAILKIYIGN